MSDIITTTIPTMPLGQATVYPDHYDPKLLCPIPRQETRQQLGLTEQLPFVGKDCWTAYELSWLDSDGKPQVRLAEIFFDCLTPCIVESKSLKLYLNSYNQTSFASDDEVRRQIQAELSTASGGAVTINLYPLDCCLSLSINSLPGVLLDDEEVQIQHYSPQADLLAVDKSQSVYNEIVYSHLLKTNCPVTDQPDWATLFIEYSGAKIVPSRLLTYIISYRQHQDFHENCVEKIFCDIIARCSPESLCVYARYTRRGGLDINPLRSNFEANSSQLSTVTLRTARQ